jgi:hypothetical protein
VLHHIHYRLSPEWSHHVLTLNCTGQLETHTSDNMEHQYEVLMHSTALCLIVPLATLEGFLPVGLVAALALGYPSRLCNSCLGKVDNGPWQIHASWLRIGNSRTRTHLFSQMPDTFQKDQVAL